MLCRERNREIKKAVKFENYTACASIELGQLNHLLSEVIKKKNLSKLPKSDQCPAQISKVL